MGNRDVIDELSGSGATVLTQVLKLIDKYDLYGHVSYPKHHKQPEVPEIYRLAARTKVSRYNSEACRQPIGEMPVWIALPNGIPWGGVSTLLRRGG
jgi:hypothetical protein